MTSLLNMRESSRKGKSMKQFLVVLKFELQHYFKNKIFTGITIFLVLAIGILMFFPRISGFFKGDSEPSEPGKKEVMLVSADAEEGREAVRQLFAAAFPGYDVQIIDGGEEAVKEQISSDKADCAFVITNDVSYIYYVNNLSMYDANTSIADEVLQNIYRINAMTEQGLSPETANTILSVQIEHEVESLGKDQMENFFYTYIMIFALYMVILLYGQMVATNVATEKSSRAMELLITSVKPSSMMFGKVIGSGLAGLTQLVLVFGAAVLFYNVNAQYWSDNYMIQSIFNMPVQLLGYMLIFFILGFFIYAFLYGAIGSTASKVEDINTSVMPLTFLFIAAFVIVVVSMSSGTMDNIAMKICSFIPFTSPIAMFTRIAMSTVPLYEIIISIFILIISVLGIGIVSAKIYRVGVLLYCTKPKIGAMLKAMKNA